MFFYILFLIFIFLISGLFQFNDRRISKSITIFGIIILIIVSITRYDVGYDYPAYYTMVYPLDQMALDRTELGYRLFLEISSLFKEPHLQFILAGLITYILTFNTIWKFSENIGLSIIIYIGLNYLFTFGLVRQALAVSLVFFSYRYVLNKKLGKFFFCIFLASLFHLSGIIGIILYPCYNWLSNKFLLISILGISAVASILMKILLSNPAIFIYSGYLEEGVHQFSGGSLVRIFYVFLWLIQLILAYIKKDKQTLKIVIITLPSIILPFIIGGHLGIRISQYFIIFYTLTIPKLLRNYSSKIKLITATIFGLYFLMEINVSMGNPSKAPYTPYQNILFVDRTPPKFKGY